MVEQMPRRPDFQALWKAERARLVELDSDDEQDLANIDDDAAVEPTQDSSDDDGEQGEVIMNGDDQCISNDETADRTDGIGVQDQRQEEKEAPNEEEEEHVLIDDFNFDYSQSQLSDDGLIVSRTKNKSPRRDRNEEDVDAERVLKKTKVDAEMNGNAERTVGNSNDQENMMETDLNNSDPQTDVEGEEGGVPPEQESSRLKVVEKGSENDCLGNLEPEMKPCLNEHKGPASRNTISSIQGEDLKTVNTLFSTGSGGNVRISATAMVEAEKMLREGGNHDNDSDTRVPSKDHLQSKRKPFTRPRAVDASFMAQVKPKTGIGSTMRKQRLGSGAKPVRQPLRPIATPHVASRTAARHDHDVHCSSLFSTGSGRPVKISKQSLMEAEQTLSKQDEQILANHGGNGQKDFGTHTESSVYSSETLKVQQPIPNGGTVVASLFQTGSGKSVHVKESSLTDATNIFHEAPPRASPNTTTGSLFSTGNVNPVKIDPKSLAKAQAGLENEEAPQSLFSTGRGNPVKIDPKSLAKAQAGLEKEETPQSLFSTGRGNPVKIDPKSLAKAQAGLENEETPQSLFSTGRGNPVKIDPKSLAKAQAGLENEETPQSLFSTGRGNLVKIDPKSLAKAQAGLENEEAPQSLFSTGRGNPVKIDPKSLAKAQAGLEKEETPQSLFSTGRGNPVKIDPKSLAKAQAGLENEEAPQSLFSTGRGKPVQIDPKALLKAQVGLDNTQTPPRVEGAWKSPSLGGKGRRISSKVSSSLFATGSGEPVRISQSALKMAERELVMSTEDQVTFGASASKVKRGFPSRQTRFTHAKEESPRSRPALSAKCTDNVGSSPKISLRTLAKQNVNNKPDHVPVDARHVVRAINAANAVNVYFSENGEVRIHMNDEGCSMSEARGWTSIAEHEFLGTDKAWVRNHYRWIVWKLASYERCFPNSYSLGYLDVVKQLRKRHEKELVQVKRPIIRKVLEKDAPATVHMVVCVAQIENSEILVTDGWYGVLAKVDVGLLNLIRSNQLKVGDKLHVCGASMLSNENGIAPLECMCNNPSAYGEPKLLISRNCTAPARWDTRLGLQAKPFFTKSLAHVANVPKTVVPSICGTIVRMFSPLFCERDGQSGTWRFHTRDQEDRLQRDFENQVMNAREAIVSELQSEWDANYQSQQTDSQAQRSFNLQKGAMEKAFETDPRMPKPRNVSILTCFLIQEMDKSNMCGLFSFWGSSESSDESQGLFHEGSNIRIQFPVVGGSKPPHSRLIPLQSNSLTRFVPFSFAKVKGYPSKFTSRGLVAIHQIAKEAARVPYFDTVGVIVDETDSHYFFTSMVHEDSNRENRDRYKVFLAIAKPQGESSNWVGLKLGDVVAIRDGLFSYLDTCTGFCVAMTTHHTMILSGSAEYIGTNKHAISKAEWAHLRPCFQEYEKFMMKDPAMFSRRVEELKSIVQEARTSNRNSITASNETPVQYGAKNVASGLSPSSKRRPHPHLGLQATSKHPLRSPNRMSQSISLADRLRTQKLKQEEWKRQHAKKKQEEQQRQAALSNPKPRQWTITNPFVLFIKKTHLDGIMVGKKTVDIRLCNQTVSHLRMYDIIKFQSGMLSQLVTVKASIPYRSCEQLVKHEDLRAIFPFSPNISQEEAMEQLTSEGKGVKKGMVYAIHFTVYERPLQ